MSNIRLNFNYNYFKQSSMGKKRNLETEKFSFTRQILSTFNEIVVQFPYMRGLVEIDVTDARFVSRATELMQSAFGLEEL